MNKLNIMPTAVTHVILTIILLDLFRDYLMKNHKRYLTLHTLFIGGVAGLLPDIDILLGWSLAFLEYIQTYGVMVEFYTLHFSP